MGLGSRLRLAGPGDDALGSHFYDGIFGDVHVPVLGVFLAQQGDGLPLLRARLQQFGSAEDEDVTEVLPVLVVAVNDEGYLGVGQDVADPLEAGERGALGLLVENGIDMLAVKGETDRDDVGRALSVGGS